MRPNKIFLIATVCMLVCSSAQAKVYLYLHYFNCPEFLQYQVASFNKFLEDDFQITVYNDAIDQELNDFIEYECARLKVNHIRVPPWVWEKPYLDNSHGLGGASFDCVCSIQWLYDTEVRHSEDVCVLLDNDMFLIQPASFETELGEFAFAFFPQHKSEKNEEQSFEGKKYIEYMLPNFLILKPSAMPENYTMDFNLGPIEGINTDSGGKTYYYLKKYGEYGLKRYELNLFTLKSHVYSENFDYPITFLDQFVFKYPLLFDEPWRCHTLMDQKLFHLRMGSNWSCHPEYENMLATTFAFLTEILQR